MWRPGGKKIIKKDHQMKTNLSHHLFFFFFFFPLQFHKSRPYAAWLEKMPECRKCSEDVVKECVSVQLKQDVPGITRMEDPDAAALRGGS